MGSVSTGLTTAMPRSRFSPSAAALPAAPVFSATAVSNSQFNLTWSSVSGASGYVVDVWINGAWQQVASLGSGTANYAATGLSAGTTYCFDVAVYNAAGTAWANYVSATTTAGGTGSQGNSGSQTTQITKPAAATAYSNVSGSLFATNGPLYLDVHQGGVGDCWLLASLAEVAARDPADITSMFTSAGTTVENGVTVGLYNVRFYNSQGVAKYVTVDMQLPSAGGYLSCTILGAQAPRPARPSHIICVRSTAAHFMPVRP